MDVDINHSPQLAMAWPCETGSAMTAAASNVPRDHNASDMLLDKFFDHSHEIDETALDNLLDTKFDSSGDLSSRRASFNFDTTSQTDHQAIASSVEPSKPEQHSPLSLQTSSHPPATSHSMTMPGLSVNVSGSYQAPASMHLYAPDAFEHQSQPFRSVPPQQQPQFANNGHWYPNFNNTSNMTSPMDYAGTGFGVGPTAFGAHDGYWQYPSPMRPNLRPGTADLVDYVNVIPEAEEDNLGDDFDGGEAADPCYAQLLYRCLKEAPDHTLSLKDLYNWVSEHSQKAKDTTSKGWQNSVRHNLSMNAAFERVTAATHHGAAKKGSLWRLTPQALQEGVISTTRYRKDPKRKTERRSSPALKRQISGAKGGQATRAAAHHRRQVQARLNSMRRNARERFNRQQPPSMYDSPTSAGSCRPSASPSPGFFPAQPQSFQRAAMSGTPHPTSAPSSHAPSPYFMGPVDNDFSFVGGQPNLGADPHTPPQVQIGYDIGGNRKEEEAGLLTQFELAHLNPSDRRLFGNMDDGMSMIEGAEVETPSLTTEASFFSEERGSAEPAFG